MWLYYKYGICKEECTTVFRNKNNPIKLSLKYVIIFYFGLNWFPNKSIQIVQMCRGKTITNSLPEPFLWMANCQTNSRREYYAQSIKKEAVKMPKIIGYLTSHTNKVGERIVRSKLNSFLKVNNWSFQPVRSCLTQFLQLSIEAVIERLKCGRNIPWLCKTFWWSWSVYDCMILWNIKIKQR